MCPKGKRLQTEAEAQEEEAVKIKHEKKKEKKIKKRRDDAHQKESARIHRSIVLHRR